MEQVAGVMRQTIDKSVTRLAYKSDILDLKKTIKSENFIQLHITINTEQTLNVRFHVMECIDRINLLFVPCCMISGW